MRRRLLHLELRVQAPDGGVSMANTYAPIADVWGTLGAARAVAHVGEEQVVEEVTHRAVIPWVDPTTFSHVTASGGAQRFRKRESRDPDNRRRVLELTLEEEVPEIA